MEAICRSSSALCVVALSRLPLLLIAGVAKLVLLQSTRCVYVRGSSLDHSLCRSALSKNLEEQPTLLANLGERDYPAVV